MQVAIFPRLDAVQRHIPHAARCTAPIWTSEVWRRVNQLAQVRRHRQAVECRLRHRLTLLPWPPSKASSAGSGVTCLAKSSLRAWSAVASVTASRKSSSLWARKRRRPVVDIWFLQLRSVVARDAHSAEHCRRHALFKNTSPNEPSKMERARVALACAWMQLLKLQKTATSQGCKYEFLCGGMKHTTT